VDFPGNLLSSLFPVFLGIALFTYCQEYCISHHRSFDILCR